SVALFSEPAPARNYAIAVEPVFGGFVGSAAFETTSSSGTFGFTIPSGTPAGIQTYEVGVEFLQCSSGVTCAVSAIVSVFVNPSPSVLGYELGAGSGVTVGWIILLALIVVVAVVLVLMIRRKGSRPLHMSPTSSDRNGPSGYGSEMSSAPSAPPPEGASGGVAPWHEPSSESSVPPDSNSGHPSGSPPLPNPPTRP
ncbi:MAG: hypothetical protein ACREC5_08410, partial [Thermoplasmata archaeon]